MFQEVKTTRVFMFQESFVFHLWTNKTTNLVYEKDFVQYWRLSKLFFW